MEARILKPGDEAMLVEAARVVDEDEVPTPERARQLLADPCFVAVVALDDGPAGLAYCHVLPQMTGTALLIYSVDTTPSRQRRGCATAMIEALKALCRERGYYEMWVPTNAGNAAAMGLYAASGGVREDDDEAIFVFAMEG